MPSATLVAGGKPSHNPSKSVSNMKELLLMQELGPRDEWRNIKLTMITPAFAHMWYSQEKAQGAEAYAHDAEYFKDVAKNEITGNDMKILFWNMALVAILFWHLNIRRNGQRR